MKDRITALTAIILAVVLCLSGLKEMEARYSHMGLQNNLVAWWGTLYPEVCFTKTENQENEGKICFWLAKVFDW